MVKSQLGWFLCESKGKSFDLSLESLLFWVQSGNKVYFQITKCILTPLYVTEKLIVLLGANEGTIQHWFFEAQSLNSHFCDEFETKCVVLTGLTVVNSY